jgi:thiol-disulfide isomerase/thioredoxin
MRFLLALIFFPVFIFAQNTNNAAPTGSFTLNGNIKGLPDSTMVFLAHPGQTADVLATGYAQKGKFNLFGKISDGDIYQLSFIGYPEVAEVFLTPANLSVTGDVKALKKVSITGSVAAIDYQEYKAKFDPLKEKLDKIVAVANKTSEGAKRDSLVKVFEQTKQKVLDQVDFFIKTKPASPVTSFIIYVTSPITNNDMAVLEKRYNGLKPVAKETFYGKEIAKFILSSKVGAVGTNAIEFTQNDTANKPVSLSSFKGKYVLVDFWASWCGPCRNENPAVVAAYNAYKDKNFTILSVSLDQNKDKWKQAIKADNLAWNHVSDLKYWQNEVAQLYHIQSIPANMLLDPNGKIIARDLRGQALYEMLGKLLK